MKDASSGATSLEGRSPAAAIRAEAARRAAAFTRRAGRPPGLTAVLVGGDDGTRRYLKQQQRKADAAGIHARVDELPASVSTDDVAAAVQSHSDDPVVDGIVVATPLPPDIDGDVVRRRLDPATDVDGAHPFNRGRLFAGAVDEGSPYVPCTASGILRLLRHHGVDPAGRHAVVVGRSLTVGRPTAALLLAADATVTICHSLTEHLAGICRRADILVAAAGVPGLIGADHVGGGAAVVDVGIHFRDGELVGDVDREAVQERAAAVTPVPGGVGPMTVAALLANTVEAAERQLRVG